jgi:S1-C subfamily serine protease
MPEPPKPMTILRVVPACTFTFCLVVLLACGHRAPASRLLIDNGRAAATGEYPAVVFYLKQNAIFGCTGTFLDDVRLLTAAHCIYDADRVIIKIGETDVVSVRTVIHPAYDATRADERQPSDLAIVYFPPGTSRSSMHISRRGVAVGAPVMMVGFGVDSRKSILKQGDKEVGSSVVDHIDQGYITSSCRSLVEVLPAGMCVALNGGDSGGPLLSGGEVIGVASGTARGSNVHVDLSTELSRSFPEL